MNQMPLHRRLFESVIANAIWATLSSVGGIITPWTRLSALVSSDSLRLFIGLVLLGLGVLGWIISYYYSGEYTEKLRHAKPWLVPTMLRVQCNILLRSYRHLHGIAPALTKYPLNPQSWPSDPVATWSLEQIRMHALNEQFDQYQTLASSIAEEMGWPDYMEICHLDRKHTLMVELIAALEKFDDLLIVKSAALGARA